MNQLNSSLRELKTRTGLSLAGLAAKTPYSKSSWERYLNGRTLPPREAVEELCRLAGEPEGRCVALWEIAEAETSGRGASEALPPPPAASPVPVPAPVPVPVPVPEVAKSGHRGVAALAALGSLCALAVAGVVVALLLLPHHSEPHASTLPPSTTAFGPRCHESTCAGGDPLAMRCGAQPVTLAMHKMATGAWLQLRHSTECGTSWLRMWGGRIGDRIELTVSGRPDTARGAEVRNSTEANTYIYTVMAVTRPGTIVRVCFQPAGGGKRECFDGRVHDSTN